MATGINGKGWITGYFFKGKRSTYEAGFLENGSRVRRLTIPGATRITPAGINDSGKVVGTYENAAGSHGFTCLHTCTGLDVPGSTRTEATGINNHGQIVGDYIDASGSAHGFVLSSGHYTQLDVPGAIGGTAPRAINDRGTVVGSYVYYEDGNPFDTRTTGFIATPD